MDKIQRREKIDSELASLAVGSALVYCNGSFLTDVGSGLFCQDHSGLRFSLDLVKSSVWQ